MADLQLTEVKTKDNKYYHIKSIRKPKSYINGLMFDKCKYKKYLQLKREDPNLRFFICWSCNPTIDKDKGPSIASPIERLPSSISSSFP